MFEPEYATAHVESDSKNEKGKSKSEKKKSESPPLVRDVEPWPDPVNGVEVLNAIEALLRRFVAMDAHAYRAVSLWALYTHCFDAFEISPLLLLTSPTRRSGKTTTLSILGALTCRPVASANITPATVFRVVQAARPTLLVDEADSFLRDNEELRGVINSGHTRAAAVVLRCDGENHDVRAFSTFSPKAVAMIGQPPATIVDRSVRIHLKRASIRARLELLRLDRLREFEPLRRKAARWAEDSFAALRAMDPDVPDGINSARDRDNWRPLLAIADAVGSDWPRRAREAALALCGGDEGESIGEILLNDLFGYFEATGCDRTESENIVKYLLELEQRPWSEFGRNQKPLTKIGLARLLKPFEVFPTHWREGNATLRGYDREAFRDVFERYCTPLGDTDSTQSAQPYDFNDLQENRVGTKEESVPTANGCNHNKTKVCADCADSNTPQWEEKQSENGSTVVSVPFVVTHAMKQQMADLGWSHQQIGQISAIEMQRIIAGFEAAPRCSFIGGCKQSLKRYQPQGAWLCPLHGNPMTVDQPSPIQNGSTHTATLGAMDGFFDREAAG